MVHKTYWFLHAEQIYLMVQKSLAFIVCQFLLFIIFYYNFPTKLLYSLEIKGFNTNLLLPCNNLCILI